MREVEARLKISAVDKTGRVLKNVADKMNDVNRRATEFNRRQTLAANAQRDMFAMVSRYAAPAIAAYAAKEALVHFAALERQMNRIGMTAGASVEKTESAWASVQKIAKDLSYDSMAPAIEALDTLVASGQSLDEALAFLPSVLATAQATGASTADIANTGLKAASALKIEAKELQRAFDIMVTGGKAGQFELKDMAQHIPGLANSFATLGYKGEAGLKQLVAILQTIREDTGDAGAAATQAGEIFGKIFAPETSNNFKRFGIDLRKEMQAAAEAGEDAVSAFTRLSEKALAGDLSKLPMLFTDKQFREGMQSLLTSEESLRKFLDTMNSAEVDGTVWRDVQRVMGDTQGSIDRMSASWEKLQTSLGKAIAPTASTAMDTVSEAVDYNSAVKATAEKRGSGFWSLEQWGLPFREYAAGLGMASQRRDLDKMALSGGYSDPEFLKRMQQGPVRPEFEGPQRPAEFPGVSTGKMPVPMSRPSIDSAPPELRVRAAAASGQSLPAMPSAGLLTLPTRAEVQEAFKIDLGFKEEGDYASRSIADGGREAAAEIEKSASFIKVAGYDVSGAIMAAADKMIAAARSMNSLGNFTQQGPSRPAVNGDTGRSMPPSAGRPAGSAGPK